MYLKCSRHHVFRTITLLPGDRCPAPMPNGLDDFILCNEVLEEHPDLIWWENLLTILTDELERLDKDEMTAKERYNYTQMEKVLNYAKIQYDELIK